MFCQSCGKERVGDGAFCPHCGSRYSTLQEETVKSVRQESGAGTAGTAVHLAKPQPSEVSIRTDAAQREKILRLCIGENADYYLKAFAKIDRGESSFNLTALFISPLILLYRQQFDYWKKMCLPWVISFVGLNTLTQIGFATFDFGLMGVAQILGTLTIPWGLVMAFLVAKNFNRKYKAGLEKFIAEKGESADESVWKARQPSMKYPLIFMAVVVVYNSIVGWFLSNLLLGGL